MDSNVNSGNDNIRKIEDIIDIQKANGNYSVRQVAFNLPSDSESTVSANLARSLESGLTNSKAGNLDKKKLKKRRRSKRRKNPMPDVISWPSDSDITVLRMKLCLTSKDLKDNVSNAVPGDGLHQPDSSSMVNLATLMRQSQPTSKQNFNFEEYLLPLTSWEREQDTEPEIKQPKVEEEKPKDFIKMNQEFGVYDAMCSHNSIPDNLSSMNSQSGFSKNITTKSKVARFLRLYFCPCCTCLYKLERMRDDPSVYFTNRNDQSNV